MMNKLGDPKLVMLFIMRPNLCPQERVPEAGRGCGVTGDTPLSDQRFCNGSIQTLQTAVRMSGGTVTKNETPEA